MLINLDILLVRLLFHLLALMNTPYNLVILYFYYSNTDITFMSDSPPKLKKNIESAIGQNTILDIPISVREINWAAGNLRIGLFMHRCRFFL